MSWTLSYSQSAHLCMYFLSLLVALLVQHGGCSLKAKAIVASTRIHPPNVVQYIIVNDWKKRHRHHNKKGLSEEEEVTSDDELVGSGEGSGYGYDDRQEHEEATSWSDLMMDTASVTTSSLLRRQPHHYRDTKVRVAILEMEVDDGVQLRTILSNQETPTEHASGGLDIIITKDNHNTSRAALFIWISAGLMVISMVCMCLNAQLDSELREQQERLQRQQEQNRQRRRRRPRLTLEQVEKTFALQLFNGTSLIPLSEGGENGQPGTEAAQGEEPQNTSHVSASSHPLSLLSLLDECSICLDDFTAGQHVRTLSCHHSFHAACITKWLTERSASCPLCKMNLYPGDPDAEDEENNNTAQPQAQTQQGGQPTEPTETIGERLSRQRQAVAEWFSSHFSRRRNSSEEEVTNDLEEPLLAETQPQDGENDIIETDDLIEEQPLSTSLVVEEAIQNSSVEGEGSAANTSTRSQDPPEGGPNEPVREDDGGEAEMSA